VSTRMPRHAAGIEAVVVDGEAVVYDTNAGELHTLNRTATLVWQRCDGRAAIGTVVQTLASEFGAGEVVIDRDVRALLADLRARGLVSEPQ
jgi:PqqD family protein of HPr-rel-A system